MTEPVTDEEAARWEELEQAATLGPWVPDAWHALRDSDGHLVGISTPPQNGWNDARFIAAAREAMPRLLADRARLLVAVEQLLDNGKPLEYNHAGKCLTCWYCYQEYGAPHHDCSWIELLEVFNELSAQRKDE